MGTLQENQSLNAEYERNKKERLLQEKVAEYRKYVDINQKEINSLKEENQILLYKINSLTNFVYDIYAQEYNKTPDMWLDDYLKVWFDEMSVATDFEIHKIFEVENDSTNL